MSFDFFRGDGIFKALLCVPWTVFYPPSVFMPSSLPGNFLTLLLRSLPYPTFCSMILFTDDYGFKPTLCFDISLFSRCSFTLDAFAFFLFCFSICSNNVCRFSTLVESTFSAFSIFNSLLVLLFSYAAYFLASISGSLSDSYSYLI